MAGRTLVFEQVEQSRIGCEPTAFHGRSVGAGGRRQTWNQLRATGLVRSSRLVEKKRPIGIEPTS